MLQTSHGTARRTLGNPLLRLRASINEYIQAVTEKTEGVEIALSGKVTGYTGDSMEVVLPQYYSSYNGVDNTAEAVRVTSFDANVFAGNTSIEKVILPIYVSEIHAGAFEGCRNLKTTVGFGVTKIGADAFKECTSLEKFGISKYVTELGNNAFESEGSIELRVDASSAAVADATIASGANRIKLNLATLGEDESYDGKSIIITSNTEYFALLGSGVSHRNLSIASEANETYLSNITFIENTDIPISTSSAKLTLNRITVLDSPAFSLIMENENTEVALYGDVIMDSSTANAGLCKNVTLVKENQGTQGIIKAYGNVLTCNGYDNLFENLMLTFPDEGEVTSITEEEYQNFFTECTITLDVNGGVVNPTTVRVCYGQIYGGLPTPTRSGYLFDGWYTDEACTIAFTEADIPQNDITLYAKWTAHSFTINFDADGGVASYPSKEYLCDNELGELPTATRDYHNFQGWFTEKNGEGTQITVQTVMTSAEGFTVYAHWELKPVSGWVRASEAPADAQIVDRKWTYTKTTYVDSTDPNLSGYTLVSSRWVQSATGSRSYASFPSGFDTNHSIYQSFYSTGYESSESSTNKRVVNNSWAGYVYYHWMYNVAYANVTSRSISSIRLNPSPIDNFAYIYFDAFTSSANCPYLDNMYCNNQYVASYNCHGYMPSTSGLGKGTPRYCRFDYYTSTYTDYYKLFHYFKTENLESSTLVTPSSTISNVVEWVIYRSK